MISLHQALIHKAGEYLTGSESQHELAWQAARLPAVLMAAEMLGWLSQQVEEGGFRQWVSNGYGIEVRTVVRLLENNIHRPYSLILAKILRKVESFIDIYGSAGGYLKDGVGKHELDQFDDQYGKIKEGLTAEWEAYFHRVLYGIRDDGPVRLVDGNLFHFREVADWRGNRIEVDNIIDESKIGVIEETCGLVSGTIYVGY